MLSPALMLSERELLANNHRFTAAYTGSQLSATPAKKLLVLTCMDARINPLSILGLNEGDAHIVRNAGGRASDDAIRSMVISQQLLGTRQLLVIHHTQCGMSNVTNDELQHKIGATLGNVCNLDFLPLGYDLVASVRQDVSQIRQHSLLASGSDVRGYVYDVSNGQLTPVD